MKIVGALFGLLVLAAVFVVWFRAYKSIKGDSGPLISMGKRKSGKENNSLDEFIAAYKRGDVTVGNNATSAAKPAPLPVAAPAAAQAAPGRREAFVSGPAKLAYLAVQHALADH